MRAQAFCLTSPFVCHENNREIEAHVGEYMMTIEASVTVRKSAALKWTKAVSEGSVAYLMAGNSWTFVDWRNEFY